MFIKIGCNIQNNFVIQSTQLNEITSGHVNLSLLNADSHKRRFLIQRELEMIKSQYI